MAIIVHGYGLGVLNFSKNYNSLLTVFFSKNIIRRMKLTKEENDACAAVQENLNLINTANSRKWEFSLIGHTSQTKETTFI